MIDGQQTFHWQQLARRQKIYIVAAVVLTVIVIGGLAWDSTSKHFEIRRLETVAAEANRQKEEALKVAAKIATEIKVREEELSKVEAKRDVKSEQVKSAADVVRGDRAEYDRAVRERLRIVPSAGELCDQLEQLGYPCQPR